MKTKNYKNIYDFVCDVLEKYGRLKNTEDFAGINIVAHYDTVLSVLNYLVKNTDFEMQFIEISEPAWDGFCDEFILTIDSDGYLHCQKAIYEGEKNYISVDEFTFVSSDTNSKFVVTNKNTPMIEFTIGEAESYDDEKLSCGNECKEYSGKTDSGDKYHITIKGDLDLDEAYAKLDEMSARMAYINDMFSEMDYFRKLFRW